MGAAEGGRLASDQRRGGPWRQDPQDARRSQVDAGNEVAHDIELGGGGAAPQPHEGAQSTSILAVASGESEDARRDTGSGGGETLQHWSSSMKLQHSKRASRPSVRECLEDVPDEEMADLTLDVYNMFFLSDNGSQAFFYSIAVLVTKISLYVLLLIDLSHNKQFPSQQRVQVADVVMAAQFFLIPVAIITQEELITSFFIFSHLKYSPEIKIRHPGAHQWKFIVAHAARFFDGAIFLFINTCVMLLQVEDVLQIFLNFAALAFLQTIDNIALDVCLNGYWTSSLQEAAQDVVDMKFAYRHHYVHRCTQTSFVVLVWAGMMSFWASVHYYRP